MYFLGEIKSIREMFIQLSFSTFDVLLVIIKSKNRDFPGGAVVGNLHANAGDTGSIPGLGRSHMLWSG